MTMLLTNILNMGKANTWSVLLWARSSRCIVLKSLKQCFLVNNWLAIWFNSSLIVCINFTLLYSLSFIYSYIQFLILALPFITSTNYYSYIRFVNGFAFTIANMNPPLCTNAWTDHEPSTKTWTNLPWTHQPYEPNWPWTESRTSRWLRKLCLHYNLLLRSL